MFGDGGPGGGEEGAGAGSTRAKPGECSLAGDGTNARETTARVFSNEVIGSMGNTAMSMAWTTASVSRFAACSRVAIADDRRAGPIAPLFL
jgi:hypothetical protein